MRFRCPQAEIIGTSEIKDYELLFTVPLTDHEKVSQIEGVKVIGHITKSELGCALVTRDGNELELKAQGWNPLKGE